MEHWSDKVYTCSVALAYTWRSINIIISFVIFYSPISQPCRSPSISSVSEIPLSLSAITATFFLLFAFSMWLVVPMQDMIIYDTLGGTYKGLLQREIEEKHFTHHFKIKYSSRKWHCRLGVWWKKKNFGWNSNEKSFEWSVLFFSMHLIKSFKNFYTLWINFNNTMLTFMFITCLDLKFGI